MVTIRDAAAAPARRWRAVGFVPWLLLLIALVGLRGYADHQERTASLHIAARVPPRATLSIEPVAGPVGDEVAAGIQRVRLLVAATAHYRLSVTSANGAPAGGGPVLLDPHSGTRVPYAILHDGRRLVFERGEASLGGRLPQGRSELAIVVPEAAAAGRFEDLLVVTLAAP